MAFIEAEAGDIPRLGAQGAVALEPLADGPGRAWQAGEGDMRVVGALFGRQPGAAAGARDPPLELCERLTRRDARPDRGGGALVLEMADPGDFGRKG